MVKIATLEIFSSLNIYFTETEKDREVDGKEKKRDNSMIWINRSLLNCFNLEHILATP